MDSTLLLSGHTCRLLLLLHYRPLAVLHFRRESPFFPLFYSSGPLSSYRRLPRVQLLNRSSTTGISCFLWQHYPRLTRASRSVKEQRESGGSTILFFFLLWSRSQFCVGALSQTQQHHQPEIPPPDTCGDGAAASSLLSSVLQNMKLLHHPAAVRSVVEESQQDRQLLAAFIYNNRLTDMALTWWFCHPLCNNPWSQSVLQQYSQVSICRCFWVNASNRFYFFYE